MSRPIVLGLVSMVAACGGSSGTPGQDGGATAADATSAPADAAAPGPDGAPIDPTLFEVVKPAERDARWSEARCNDGTPFAFVVRRAPASDTWVIYLEGGVFCDDYAFACSERAPYLITTLQREDGSFGPVPFGGLVSNDPTVNPDFADANQVVAHYCSSDFWSGATAERRPSSGDPAQGWYFSGHANVQAMFEILAEDYGLDDSQAGLRVLFGGGSAGAFGAHFNAHLAATFLPAAAEDGRLAILADAGWMFDWDDPDYRIGAATTSDRDVWGRARDFWAGTFDPDCEAAELDPTSCLYGPGWYAHVAARTPVFIQQSRRDSSFAGVHGLSDGDPAMNTWQAIASATLLEPEWLFSGEMPYHVLALQDGSFQMGPAGSTFQQTLGRFWSGGPGEHILF